MWCTLRLPRPRAIGAAVAMVVAPALGAACDGSTDPPRPRPIARIVVSPDSILIDRNQEVALSAVALTAWGDTADVAVRWGATGGNVRFAGTTGRRHVNAYHGAVCGGHAVWATSDSGDRSDTAQVGVACPPPPPPAASCLTQPGTVITVSGVLTAPFQDTSLADGTKIAASAARFVTADNIPVRLEGGSGVCWSGGALVGRLPPSTSWSRMHDTYGMVARGAMFRLQNLRVFNYGDGVTLDAADAAGWSIQGAYFTYMRDDCVENDFLNSGTIEDSFFDGCYSGFSSRPFTGTEDGRFNVVVVRNTLFRLQAMDRGFLRPGHEGFWKWGPTSPLISLYHNVFLASAAGGEADVLLPRPDRLKDCEDNVMIWLSDAPFPERLPARPGCFTLLTGDAGRQYWNAAVARWNAAHPEMLRDVGAPIVALWAPSDSATLSGTVPLTATAVDDQAVAAVQFALNGDPIGPAVTTEGPVTKFTLTWDSRTRPDGTYTLTATARDAAGAVTLSAGVPVTIRN